MAHPHQEQARCANTCCSVVLNPLTGVFSAPAYRIALVLEHGVILLTPFERLPPPFLYRDIMFPIKHAGRAAFIKDPDAVPRSSHIILLKRDSNHPKSELQSVILGSTFALAHVVGVADDATHLYTFTADTQLLPQLQNAWINWHIVGYTLLSTSFCQGLLRAFRFGLTHSTAASHEQAIDLLRCQRRPLCCLRVSSCRAPCTLLPQRGTN